MAESKTHDRVREVYTHVATRARKAKDLDQHARRIGYSDEELAAAPEGSNVAAGCGNPSAIDTLRPGETVVDLGSGAGMDAFLAARQVGPDGRVIGVDMTDAMLEKARKNAASSDLQNVEFRKGTIEALPLEDASVDVILSNCVISLSPDKKQVYREAHRVLRPGGRAMVSDLVLSAPVPKAMIAAADALLGFGGGVELRDDYLALIRGVGFEDVRVTSEAAFGDSLIDEDRAEKLAEVLSITPDAVKHHASALVSIHVYARKPS
jgi:SAM-dependent methyltransferase